MYFKIYYRLSIYIGRKWHDIAYNTKGKKLLLCSHYKFTKDTSTLRASYCTSIMSYVEKRYHEISRVFCNTISVFLRGRTPCTRLLFWVLYLIYDYRLAVVLYAIAWCVGPCYNGTWLCHQCGNYLTGKIFTQHAIYMVGVFQSVPAMHYRALRREWDMVTSRHGITVFVRGIRPSSTDSSTHKALIFFVVSLNQLLNKQSSCRVRLDELWSSLCLMY